MADHGEPPFTKAANWRSKLASATADDDAVTHTLIDGRTALFPSETALKPPKFRAHCPDSWLAFFEAGQATGFIKTTGKDTKRVACCRRHSCHHPYSIAATLLPARRTASMAGPPLQPCTVCKPLCGPSDSDEMSEFAEMRRRMNHRPTARRISCGEHAFKSCHADWWDTSYLITLYFYF